MSDRIILVDDDDLISMIVKRMLERLEPPSEVTCLPNGKEALDFFLENPGLGNCILLLDINMPVMNGWEFLDAIRDNELLDGIYGCILTSSVNEADRRKASEYSCIHKFLEKPITSQALEELKKEFRLSLENVH